MKRLSDAVRDGDTIRSIIRSTGTNQDGHTPGITQPNKLSQVALIRDTYAKAGLDMSRTRYFEAHGTGTSIGDPIEANAIGAAFEGNGPIYVYVKVYRGQLVATNMVQWGCEVKLRTS